MPGQLLHIYGPLFINSFGLFVGIALIIFCYFVEKEIEKKHLISRNNFSHLLVLSVFAALIGGRILYVINNWNSINNIYHFFDIWNGGFSLLGAVLALLIVIPLYLKVKRITILPFLDVLAVYVPLFQSIARIGCFFAGCCYGQAVHLPWSTIYTECTSLAPLNVPLHPTQLYSSLLLFIIFLSMRYIFKHQYNKPGQLITLYLILICCERIMIDFLRGDREFFSSRQITLLSIHQIVAIILALGASIAFIYFGRQKQVTINKTV